MRQQRWKEKLSSTHAYSVIELICLSGMIILAVLALVFMVQFYRESARRSYDNHLEDTAWRAATLNLADSGCIVGGCPGYEKCTHRVKGRQIGYLDHRDNTITGELPEGYNYSSVMKVDREMFRRKRNSMVIRTE